MGRASIQSIGIWVGIHSMRPDRSIDKGPPSRLGEKYEEDSINAYSIQYNILPHCSQVNMPWSLRPLSP